MHGEVSSPLRAAYADYICTLCIHPILMSMAIPVNANAALHVVLYQIQLSLITISCKSVAVLVALSLDMAISGKKEYGLPLQYDNNNARKG